MNSDATEAALGLLGLSPFNAPQLIPQKRKQSPVPPLPPPVDLNSDDIHCICGFGFDDGFSIACDDCSRWCHAACFKIAKETVPEEWSCWVCSPRPVDRERAVKLQRMRLKQAEDVQHTQRQQQQQQHQHQPQQPQHYQMVRGSPGAERKPKQRASASAIEGSKRKRRSSLIVTPVEEELIDIDEPTYMPITKDIIPQQDTREKLLRQAQDWRGVTALSLPPPPTTIQPVPTSAVRPPSYAMHTTTPVQTSTLIAPFTSTITSSASYLADPLNAYAHLGMPKPFVHLLGHPLDLTLDARATGDKSRFVRSGCKPNAVLRPVLCKGDETLTFGVFALRDLSAGEEVVLGWEWDDGHAVHSLPALIQNPHTFPLPQRVFLCQQMIGILHALSSTFTTCACGAKARDCALAQMAKLVDGDEVEEENVTVDLGPLVGSSRGFRTRERVPMSGGLSGVEMDVDVDIDGEVDIEGDDEQPIAGPSKTKRSNVGDVANAFRTSHLSPPVVTISPATAMLSPLKAKSRSWKGKAKAVCEEEEESSDSGGGLVSPSLRHKKHKRRRRSDDPPGSPLLHPFYLSDNDRRDLEPILIDQYALSPVKEIPEEQMPPKMRKRWIHQSAETLKDLVASGQVGGSDAGVGNIEREKIMVDNSRVEVTAQEVEPDRLEMEVDNPPDLTSLPEENFRLQNFSTPPSTISPTLKSTPKHIPMPPPLSSMDPIRQYSHTPKPSPTAIPPRSVAAIIRALSPSENLISPSTSFAKLSLLSPQVFGPHSSPMKPTAAHNPLNQTINYFPRTTPRQNTSSPSPLSQIQNGVVRSKPIAEGDVPITSTGGGKLEEHVPSVASPILDVVDIETPIISSPDIIKDDCEMTRTPISPHPLELLPALERKLTLELNLLIRDSPLSPDEPQSPHSDSIADTPRSIAPGSPVIPRSASPTSTSTPTPPPLGVEPEEFEQETPAAPPATSSSPLPVQPTKVKISLKDFALRKKKQREEEMALAKTELVVEDGQAEAAENHADGHNLMDVDSEQQGAVATPPAQPNGAPVNRLHLPARAEDKANAMVVDAGEKEVELSSPTSSPPGFNDAAHSGGPNHKSPAISLREVGQHRNPPSPQQSPDTPAAVHLHNIKPNAILDMKMEVRDMSTPLRKSRDDTNGSEGSSRGTPPRTFNGITPSSFPSSGANIPSLSSRISAPAASVRHLSHEDGEIPNLTPPSKQPFFAPRSHARPHTPPTQPRSFSMNAPLPASTVSIPSSIPNRPARPLPSGPRALRIGNQSGTPGVFPPSRPISSSHFIPRGPSADRDRMDWDRDRSWPGPSRGRGRGVGGSWGR